MKGINKVILVGNVWKDPVIRTTKNDSKIAQVSMVTESGWGEYKKADWHNVVFFGRQAEVASEYLNKGREVYIEGRLKTSQYEKEGQTKYFTQVIGENFKFLGSKNS